MFRDRSGQCRSEDRRSLLTSCRRERAGCIQSLTKQFAGFVQAVVRRREVVPLIDFPVLDPPTDALEGFDWDEDARLCAGGDHSCHPTTMRQEPDAMAHTSSLCKPAPIKRPPMVRRNALIVPILDIRASAFHT